jgi:hypothetical protein
MYEDQIAAFRAGVEAGDVDAGGLFALAERVLRAFAGLSRERSPGGPEDLDPSTHPARISDTPRIELGGGVESVVRLVDHSASLAD